MGMRIEVYRSAHRSMDCTMGGASSRCSELTVMNVEGPFEPTPEAPAALLISHVPGCLRICPVEGMDRWQSMGGNFGHTSDSRFSQKCEQLTGAKFYGAVAIHDRVEA